ncbi:MAG: fibronectin type III domain-containing protein, partial [Candidatus Binatia bacterium]
MSRTLHSRGWILFALGWSLLAVFASADTVFAVLLRQPYLQLVTSNSVTVVWRTDLSAPNDSRVQYGTGALNQTASGAAVIPASNANAKDHFVMINGLTPGTKYFYNVGTTSGGVEGGGTSEHYFMT